LVFSDPLLDSEIELVPDMLVVDEHKRPPALDSLSMCIPSAPAFEPYLTPESPRYPSVVTPKAGIIAVGPARGVFGRNEILADIRAAVEHISADARLETSAPVCVSEKCAICLTCVRMCPHGALGFTHIASPDAASCRECGICAAECPMSAIRFTPATLGAEVSAAAENAVHLYGTGSTVAFLCEKSGAQAFESVKDKAPAGVLPVVVPCAGSIGPTHIMEALTAGARSVIVAGCFSGNCASIYGTDLARERAASVTAMLAEMGIDTSRVSYLPLASNAGSRLLRHLERVCGEA
jgi:coenzyme F420-reducing hydrogenase delta subunit/Pyruvate/2-oxoacid:ferredoxin oxidoreductase delta subunit